MFTLLNNNIIIIICIIRTSTFYIIFKEMIKFLFSIAISNSNTEMIKFLISKPYIDVNGIIKVNKEKKTPLFIAIEKEDIEVTNILLSDPNININKGIGSSIIVPIILSIFFPFLFLIIVFFLNYNISGKKKTPLELAIEIGNIEIIKILLSHPEIEINHNLKTQIFHSALNARNTEVMQIFDKKVEKNCKQNTRLIAVIAILAIFLTIICFRWKLI